MEREKLYKIDSKGKTRVWWIEYDTEKYRTHSGINGGKIVTSGWQYPTEKNVGRANATSIEEQVLSEITAEYEKKLNQGKYHSTIESASNGAKFYECMLASKYDPKKHNNFPYYSQPKLDGIRCLISKDGMQSRQGKPIISAPHIMEVLADFFKEFPDVVLDGELYNHELKDNFEKIVSLVRKTKPTDADLEESKRLVQYHVYDVIKDDLLASRLDFLRNANYLHGHKSIKIVTSYIVDDDHAIETMLVHYLEQGYEGQMLRVPESPYEGKRSKNLIKHKEFEDAEFEIVSIEEGVGDWAGCAKSIGIRLPDGRIQYSNTRGTVDFLKDILYHADRYIGTEVTVRYQRKTDDGKLRFPVVVAYWGGKRDL